MLDLGSDNRTDLSLNIPPTKRSWLNPCILVSFLTKTWGRVMACWMTCCLSYGVQAASYTAVVTHLETGSVFAHSNGQKQVFPASLTKLMTLYLTFDALNQGKVALLTPLCTSLLASNQRPSKWGVKPKEKVSVLQCILGLSVKSSNDLAIVLAEHIGKSVPDFVSKMNAKAAYLGMRHTHFENPSGWHHPLQKTTAYDMAILLRAMYHHFPQYVRFLGTRYIQKGGKQLRNTNKLLGCVPGLFLGKTGFTCPSGYNLITATKRPCGPGIICTIMGMPSKQERDQLMTKLIDTFYKNPQYLTLAIQQPALNLPNRVILGAASAPMSSLKKARIIGANTGQTLGGTLGGKNRQKTARKTARKKGKLLLIAKNTPPIGRIGRLKKTKKIGTTAQRRRKKRTSPALILAANQPLKKTLQKTFQKDCVATKKSTTNGTPSQKNHAPATSADSGLKKTKVLLAKNQNMRLKAKKKPLKKQKLLKRVPKKKGRKAEKKVV